MTHVLLCTEGSYPFSVGGVSTWCEQLVRGAGGAGYRFTVHAAHPSPGPAPELPGAVTALRVVGPGPSRPSPNALITPARCVLFDEALGELVRGAVGDPAVFGGALHRLAAVGAEAPLWPMFGRRAARDVVRAATLDASGLLLTSAETAAVTRWLQTTFASLLSGVSGEYDLTVATTAGPGALPAWLAARRAHVPFVLVEHGVALRETLLALRTEAAGPGERRVRAAFAEQLTRLLYHDADVTIAVCRFNTVWERRLGLPLGRGRVIHNGVDPSRFPDVSARVASAPTVGWIGRLDPFKGLEGLIDAFGLVRRSLPHACLRLYGPTPRGNEAYVRSLTRRVREAGLSGSVSFEGPARSVQAALAACDLIALPSVTEGLPYGVLEAMMSGRVVVAHDVGGVSEALGDTGRLVAPHDPEAFAAVLLDVLGDPARRRDLGAAARRRAIGRFSEAAMLRRYLATFADLLERTPA